MKHEYLAKAFMQDELTELSLDEAERVYGPMLTELHAYREAAAYQLCEPIAFAEKLLDLAVICIARDYNTDFSERVVRVALRIVKEVGIHRPYLLMAALRYSAVVFGRRGNETESGRSLNDAMRLSARMGVPFVMG